MNKQFKILKSLAIIWLLFVVVISILAMQRGTGFDSSIMTLLPKSQQNSNVQNATQQMTERFSKRLLLLLSAEDEHDVRQAVAELATRLATMPEVAEVTWQVNVDELTQSQQQSFPYRFAVLDPTVRAQLLNKDFEEIKTQALLNLYSPINMGQTKLIEDPFGLFSVLSLNRKNDLNIQVSHTLLKVTNSQQPSYLILLTLADDPFSPALQNSLLTVITSYQEQFNNKGIDLTMSGMLLHAAVGAEQAKQEITTIGLGSLLGIIIMILLVFRQLKPLLLMLFAISIGCISATAVTIMVFERVHLITLAFGAGLVGVSVDYALHFLCERRVRTADTIMSKIMPGLILGLFSSVLAYAAQGFAPFPGLQQMAVFSVVGLSSAWLTVVLWFPLITSNDQLSPLIMASKLDLLRQKMPRLEKHPIMIGGLLLLLVFLAVNSLSKNSNIDDIRLLQTSPAHLLEQEKAVQQQLAASSSSQFMLIQAKTMEQCLQKEEQLHPLFNKLVATGLMGGYQSLSAVLPSLQRQTENQHLVTQLYEHKLENFYDEINLPQSVLLDAQTQMKLATSQMLTPQIWQQQLGHTMWQDLIVSDHKQGAATLIRFTGELTQDAKQQLQALSADDDKVLFVDQVQTLSDLLGDYRSEVINWVMLAYLIVFLVLFMRYKHQVWRIVLPPLLASIFTLAALVQLEQGINLFHLMALILVLGIGLDMGIFLTETRDAAHTWLAVSLSAYTSLLAFGLLAWSDTPVLHHFGLTVLLGLSFIWLLVPLMRKEAEFTS